MTDEDAFEWEYGVQTRRMQDKEFGKFLRMQSVKEAREYIECLAFEAYGIEARIVRRLVGKPEVVE